MKTWEAIKALEEGKKVRRRGWNKDWYVLMDENGDFLDDCGSTYEFDCNSDDWEIVDDRKEASEKLRELYRNCRDLFEKFDCDMDEWEVCDDYNTFEKVKELLDALEKVNKYYKLDK